MAVPTRAKDAAASNPMLRMTFFISVLLLAPRLGYECQVFPGLDARRVRITNSRRQAVSGPAPYGPAYPAGDTEVMERSGLPAGVGALECSLFDTDGTMGDADGRDACPYDRRATPNGVRPRVIGLSRS